MIRIFTKRIRANNTIHIPKEVMVSLGLHQNDLIQVTVMQINQEQTQIQTQNPDQNQTQILFQKKGS